ncbi:unnamed protein product [Sphacelaria rigidula]
MVHTQAPSTISPIAATPVPAAADIDTDAESTCVTPPAPSAAATAAPAAVAEDDTPIAATDEESATSPQASTATGSAPAPSPGSITDDRPLLGVENYPPGLLPRLWLRRPRSDLEQILEDYRAMQSATHPAPPSPRQTADDAAHRLLHDNLTARLTRQRRTVDSVTSRQQAAQETLNERLAAFDKMRDTIRRDKHRLHQYTAATATATSALRSLEQERHLSLLGTTPTTSAPAPTSAHPSSAENRRPSRLYAAAAASTASPTRTPPAPPQVPQASAPPAPTPWLNLQGSERCWLSRMLRQLSGKFNRNNVLRASEQAWRSITLPTNSVIVPFLQQGGKLPHNDPGALTIERIVLYLTIGTGDSRRADEAAVAALFAAMRAAHNTLPPDDDGAWITPHPPRHRRDDDDFDDDQPGAEQRRGQGTTRNHNNGRRTTRGTHKRSGNHSSSSSTTRHRQHTLTRSMRPSPAVRFSTPSSPPWIKIVPAGKQRRYYSAIWKGAL